MGFMFLIPIVVFIIAFLFIASTAFSTFKKNKKTVNKTISVIEQRFNDNLTKVAETNTSKSAEKICEYCGSSISGGANKCDSCGAKVKK